MNGMLEIWPGLATVVTSGCSVASCGGGWRRYGRRSSVCIRRCCGGVGSWVGCLACVGVGPLLRTGSGVAAWAQAANTSTRVVAARQRTVSTGLVRRRGIVIFSSALRKSSVYFFVRINFCMISPALRPGPCSCGSFFRVLSRRTLRSAAGGT